MFRESVSVKEAVHKLTASETEEIVGQTPEEGPEAQIDSAVHKWHFIKE